MEIKVFRTTELKVFLNQYSKTFNSVFETKFLPDYFLKKYKSGHRGYSIHSVAFNSNEIIGSFTVIPHKYNSKEKIILGLGCDAFVVENHRYDELLLFKMFKAILPTLKLEKTSNIISIPNPKASKYWSVVAKWRVIDELKIQLYPINFKNLYPASVIYIYLIYLLCFIKTNNRNVNNNLSLLNNKIFLASRYPKNIYHKLESIYFRELVENNLDIVYLFNHSGLKTRDFIRCCLRIIKKSRNKDFLAIGSNRKYFGSFKVSEKLLKRSFPIMIYDLDDKLEQLLNKCKLEVDLGSFDNR